LLCGSIDEKHHAKNSNRGSRTPGQPGPLTYSLYGFFRLQHGRIARERGKHFGHAAEPERARDTMVQTTRADGMLLTQQQDAERRGVQIVVGSVLLEQSEQDRRGQ
jgi:hypothetical protein